MTFPLRAARLWSLPANPYLRFCKAYNSSAFSITKASQLLIDKAGFLDYASMQYTYAQIAAALNVNEELAVIKGDILRMQGYELNIPDAPMAGCLDRSE
jgi:hypothetical protein